MTLIALSYRFSPCLTLNLFNVNTYYLLLPQITRTYVANELLKLKKVAPAWVLWRSGLVTLSPGMSKSYIFLRKNDDSGQAYLMRINGIIAFPKEKRWLGLSSGSPGELFIIPERCAPALNYSNSYRKTRTRGLYTHSGRSAPSNTHPGELI